jgi:hypothetical protein
MPSTAGSSSRRRLYFKIAAAFALAVAAFALYWKLTGGGALPKGLERATVRIEQLDSKGNVLSWGSAAIANLTCRSGTQRAPVGGA